MKDKTVFVQRIKSCYVNDECMQVMIPFKDTCIIFNTTDVQCFISENKVHINTYIEDERRMSFPYSKIPFHFQNKEIANVNQLLEFNKPYLVYRDKTFVEMFAIKDGNEALLLTKCLPVESYDEFTMNREEFETCIYGNSTSPCTQHYILDSNEELYKKANILSEDELKQNLDVEQPDQHTSASCYLIDLNGKEISLKMLDMVYCSGHYFVILCDIPICSHYSLDELKFLTAKDKINYRKEPKIPGFYNKNIRKTEINEQKRLVLSLGKKV